MSGRREPIIPCELLPETRDRIRSYAEALQARAPGIGNHGLNEREFWDSGIFQGAIERLRGQQAASLEIKRAFMTDILDFLRDGGEVAGWEFVGSRERHDYEVTLSGGRMSVIETKGCLDGNNTNIFERPPQADEFIIWSLCQNPGADPRHNAWSGIHTRLGAEIIHRGQTVDGVVIWDMLCGTAGRPCPKLAEDSTRATLIGDAHMVPPPCIFLLPRSIPDPRNNPRPPVHELEEVGLLAALCRAFKGDGSDVVKVEIEARMLGAELERMTRFSRMGGEFCCSAWTTIKRARR